MLPELGGELGPLHEFAHGFNLPASIRFEWRVAAACSEAVWGFFASAVQFCVDCWLRAQPENDTSLKILPHLEDELPRGCGNAPKIRALMQ